MFHAVIFSCFFSLLIHMLWTFDQLVRLEHEFYQGNWRKDGKPNGFFWTARENANRKWLWVGFRSYFARDRCLFAWMLSSPLWIKEDEKANILIRRIRVSYILIGIVWMLGVVNLVFWK